MEDIALQPGKKSKCVLGCFTNLKAFSAVVVEIFLDNSKYKVLNHRVHYDDINLLNCAKDIELLTEGYEIETILCNETSAIFEEKKYVKNIDWRFITNTNIDKSMTFTKSLFLEQRLIFNKEIMEDWEDEYKSFNLEDCVNQSEIYPLLFGLWNALEANAFTDNSHMFDIPSVAYRYAN